uniref:Uncharacterized protein n=1 Tax=Trichobilharzia regenti TaxID=157069 RepID=A0AA85JA15_TRIRE|nr:unnamed protein product [Trichobilharzia regenti]
MSCTVCLFYKLHGCDHDDCDFVGSEHVRLQNYTFCLQLGFRNILQNLFSTWYMSLAFVLIGAVFAAVLLLVQNVESQFPVNYTFLLLTVLTSSCGIAGFTGSLHLWAALSWSLAISLAVIAVVVGYQLSQLSHTGDDIMIIFSFVLMLLGGILLAAVYFSGYKVSGIWT